MYKVAIVIGDRQMCLVYLKCMLFLCNLSKRISEISWQTLVNGLKGSNQGKQPPKGSNSNHKLIMPGTFVFVL